MDIEHKLRKLEKSINEQRIDVYNSDILSIPIRIIYFEIKGYSELIVELNKLRFSCETYNEKVQYLDKYKKIYLSKKKKYRCLLRNLRNGTLKIHYSETINEETYLFDALQKLCKFKKNKSLDENMNEYMEAKLNQRIYETNEELYKLNKYPTDYINTYNTFIGPNSVIKYDSDMVFYKDVFIAVLENHHFSIFYNENSTEEIKRALLNILAYFNGQPYFYFTNNANFNRKICNLYEQFDLLDMLRLRSKNFFDSNRDEPFSLELPILKRKSRHNIICFNNLEHEMVFELYHASLKQFESLPRCVFLFRVFEYGAAHNYKKLFRTEKYKPEEALNYYANKIMHYRFNTLYYVDFGTYESNDRTKIVRERKAKYVNFTSKLKEEINKIIIEWKYHPYLKNKSIGEILYGTGRNATAHGASGRRTARYDYSMNYKHINDVNIFLELIARYIIEILNPQVANMVESRVKYYVESNGYAKIFEQQKD